MIYMFTGQIFNIVYAATLWMAVGENFFYGIYQEGLTWLYSYIAKHWHIGGKLPFAVISNENTICM